MANLVYYYVIQEIAVERANVYRFIENAQRQGFLRIYDDEGKVVWQKRD